METSEAPRRHWGRAAGWFVGSLAVTLAALAYAAANAQLMLRSAHDPMIGDPLAAICLFVVLMAPSTVVGGSLVALRSEPLRWSRPAAAVALVLLAANLVLAVAGVVDAVRPTSSPAPDEPVVEEQPPGDDT